MNTKSVIKNYLSNNLSSILSLAFIAFLTIAFMAFTYNISYGIAIGILSYVLIDIFSGKVKEIKLFTWIIAVLFVFMFLLTHWL